jgi:hypothetical protein
MQTARLYVLVAVFSSAWLISGCAATSPTPIAATAEAARITVLYDATLAARAQIARDKPEEEAPGRLSERPGRDEMRSRSGGALAGGRAARAGLALARGTALASGPTTAGHLLPFGGNACCGRIRLLTIGCCVHSMLR